MTHIFFFTAAALAIAFASVEAQAKRKPICTNSYQQIKGQCETGGNRDKIHSTVRSKSKSAQAPASAGSDSSENNEK